MTTLEYIQGSDLPDAAITWRDSDKQVIQFATGHTFELKVGHPGQPAVVTKSNGIAGANAAPNVTISWSTTGELNAIPPGRYDADLIATRNADSKQRKLRLRLIVKPAIT